MMRIGNSMIGVELDDAQCPHTLDALREVGGFGKWMIGNGFDDIWCSHMLDAQRGRRIKD